MDTYRHTEKSHKQPEPKKKWKFPSARSLAKGYLVSLLVAGAVFFTFVLILLFVDLYRSGGVLALLAMLGVVVVIGSIFVALHLAVLRD